MATAYHNEARIKQERLDRWNDQKKRAELRPPIAAGEILEDASKKQKTDRILITDPGQFDQVRSIHVWTGTERNRRHYDYSREGPILGSSWRGLQKEIRFRESSLSTNLFESLGHAIGCDAFIPADVAFINRKQF